MGGRGANKEEAERAVTRGIGFTSELPPPGSTSYPARCRLVIGWIKKEGRFFSFCIMNGRESRARNRRTERPAPLPGGCGRVGGGSLPASPGFRRGFS